MGGMVMELREDVAKKKGDSGVKNRNCGEGWWLAFTARHRRNIPPAARFSDFLFSSRTFSWWFTAEDLLHSRNPAM
jgi:hypothetical protein